MGTSVILLESSIELVPPQLWGGPSVRASARRRGKSPRRILLDKSLHRPDMHRVSLAKANKRGRPDIVHRTLLAILGSPLNLEGRIEAIYLHTVEGRIFQVDTSTRLPRSYNQFVGLMEQLLEEGRVPPARGKKLIWELDKSLEEIIENHRPFILLERGDECESLSAITEGALYGIGAFPAGEIDGRIRRLADRCVSMGPYTLDSSIVASHLTCILWRRDATRNRG